MSGMDAVSTAPPAAPAGNTPAQHVELGLTGMTCAACAARIEKVLNRMPGVRAGVNFAAETASVDFDPARGATTVRFSFAGPEDVIEQGCAALARWRP